MANIIHEFFCSAQVKLLKFYQKIINVFWGILQLKDLFIENYNQNYRCCVHIEITNLNKISDFYNNSISSESVYEVLEDHVDHQPDGFSRPVSAVVSSVMNQALEDMVQIPNPIKPEGSRSVSHHVVGFHDVKSGAVRQNSIPGTLRDQNRLIHIDCYLEE